MIPHPQPNEYAEYYGGYINRVPQGADIWAVLAAQPAEVKALLANVSEEQANQRPAPGEWSIKEVMGHVTDTERIFAYRALRIGRNDPTPIEGFEQDEYVTATDFNKRTLASFVEEFALLRQANLLAFQPMDESEWERMGTASTYPVSARALLYKMAGHVMHHVESLKTSYGVKG